MQTSPISADNQQTINYAVRCLTTGDEEDVRILEEPSYYLSNFPIEIRDRASALIVDVADPQWSDGNSDAMLALLRPFISRPDLYEADYEAWERWVLGDPES